MATKVELRRVSRTDLPTFFEFQRDPQADHMAAFAPRPPEDRDGFDAHWAKLLNDETVVVRTILNNGQVVGHVAKFLRDGKPEVTYWIGRPFWGKGIATAALKALLNEITERPIHAGAAKDNVASLRVLEKCGFVITGYKKDFARARGEEIEEAMLLLHE